MPPKDKADAAPLAFIHIDVEAHIHMASPTDLAEIRQALRTIDTKVTGLSVQLTQSGGAMSKELEALKGEVAATNTVIESGVVFINGLAAQIRDLKDDPAALAQLATDLETKRLTLAQAILDGTDVAPA